MGRLADQLYELAEAQDGYFSTHQAVEAGITAINVGKAAANGQLTRTSRGVYRLAKYPITSENVHLWEAVLWPQVRTEIQGTLSHYTALHLHELSDVNREDVHITVPIRLRRQTPSDLVVHKADLPKYDRTFIDGLPTTTVARTLLDIAALGDQAVLREAIRDARRRGLEIPPELRHV